VSYANSEPVDENDAKRDSPDVGEIWQRDEIENNDANDEDSVEGGVAELG
jgi:hypothetical protein